MVLTWQLDETIFWPNFAPVLFVTTDIVFGWFSRMVSGAGRLGQRVEMVLGTVPHDAMRRERDLATSEDFRFLPSERIDIHESIVE